jgi:hypothetical protein
MPRSFFYCREMKRFTLLCSAALLLAPSLSSCALKDPERTPTGPVSQSRQIPWNSPVPGQGQGQLGMMPQNQYRR